MQLIVSLSLVGLGLHLASGQIFPFSNLKAFFKPDLSANVSRPNRQAPPSVAPPGPPLMPALPEFDDPDIFTINRNIDNHRSPPVKRQPSPDDSPPRRRKPASRYRQREEPTPQLLPESLQTGPSDTGSVFITPRPGADEPLIGNNGGITQSKVRSRSRIRSKPAERVAEHAEPITEKEFVVPFSGEVASHPPVYQELSPAIPASEEPSLSVVESVPSLSMDFEQKPFESSGGGDEGLLDYLTPPKLQPSVYDKKFRSPSAPPKVKTPLSPKKDNRFRVKKFHGEVKTTSVPVSDRLTTKRVSPRRRPSQRAPQHQPPSPLSHPQKAQPHPQQQAPSPLSHPQRIPPPPQAKRAKPKRPVRPSAADLQGAQMDEQITAETGFSGAASAHGLPHHPHSGGERVEFQMHGQKGPHSYKFGYDTGKGHNRQFRFEEKDNHGRVKGHYGYYDKEGKLQVVNYEADHHGFHAETV